METLREQYRQFEKNLLVWERAEKAQEISATPFEAEGKLEASDFLKQYPKLAEMKPDEIERAAREYFKEKYDPEKYKAEIQAYLENNLGSDQGERIERLVKDSLSRYERQYERALSEFRNSVDDRVDAYKALLGSIREATQGELGLIKETIQNTRDAVGVTLHIDQASPKVPKELLGGNWPYKIPLMGPILKNFDIPILTPIIANRGYLEHKEFSAKMNDEFLRQFLPALNAQYLNLDWQRRNLSPQKFKKYEELSEKFSDRIATYVKDNLNHVLETSADATELEANLGQLRDTTIAQYSGIAKDGLIDLNELAEVDRVASKCASLTQMVTGFANNEEELIQNSEAINMMGLDQWVKSSGKVVEMLASRAEDDGADARFVEAVRSQAQGETVENFDQAKAVLKKLLGERTKLGLQQGMELVRDINKAVYADQGGFQNLEFAPAPIRGLVERERRFLIEGRTRSNNVDDINVIQFMHEPRAGREAMLISGVGRDELFRSIRNIQARDSDPEIKRELADLPKKTGELTTGYAVDKPTSHDRLARHLALMSLADEAEWAIGNLADTDSFKGKGLAEELDNAQKDSKPAPLNTNFVDTQKRASTRYVTEAERAGLSGMGVGLGLLQAWGAITLLLNIKAAYEPGKIGEMPEKILKSAAAWSGFAALAGVEAYKRNPEITKAISASPGEWERIMQNFKFATLSKTKKFCGIRLQDFMENADEAEVMEKLMAKDQGGKAVERALESAAKRNPDTPMLEREDLIKQGLDASDVSQILGNAKEGYDPMRSAQWARARYLFYQKFLPTPVKQLRKNYELWRASPQSHN